MCAVDEHGRPLVEDPNRVGQVNALGVDETSFLRATREHPTLYATGLVDLDEPILIDLVEGNSGSSVRTTTATGAMSAGGSRVAGITHRRDMRSGRRRRWARVGA
jgi:hypothetical protein